MYKPYQRETMMKILSLEVILQIPKFGQQIDISKPSKRKNLKQHSFNLFEYSIFYKSTSTNSNFKSRQKFIIFSITYYWIKIS